VYRGIRTAQVQERRLEGKLCSAAEIKEQSRSQHSQGEGKRQEEEANWRIHMPAVKQELEMLSRQQAAQ